MIRLLWRTDVHLSDQTPSSRKDDWRSTVLRKLAWVGEQAQGCDAVLDGGDFFNDKTPSRNSHEMISKVMDVHKAYPCPVLANVGNHDVRLGHLDNLYQAPLETLFRSGTFQRCYGEHEVILERDGVRVKVVGVPYHGPKYDLDRFRIEKGEADHLVVMGHVLASKYGGTMFEGEDIVDYRVLPELCPDASVFFFGHWHKDQGVEKISDSQWVVNIGALTRGSLSQDNLERVPRVARVELTKPDGLSHGVKIDLIEVPIEGDVFDVARKEREDRRERVMGSFVAKLRKVLDRDPDKSIESKLDTMEIAPDVKERFQAILEKVS